MRLTIPTAWLRPLGAAFAILSLLGIGAAAWVTFGLRHADSATPCAELAKTISQPAPTPDGRPADDRLTVIDFYPKTKAVSLGGEVCVALRGGSAGAPPKDFHLILDDADLKFSHGRVVDPARHLVVFDLHRHLEDADSWNKVVALSDWGLVTADVGVATEGGVLPVTDGLPRFGLIIYSQEALVYGGISLLAAILSICMLSSISGILRDGPANTSYSLARVQVAFWFYLITAAFLYIWLVTGEYNGTLTSDALALLGISAATGLSSITVGQNSGPSHGFITDLLDDGTGISLHRMQMAVWTLVLGGVFVSQVWLTLRLPRFDSNLMILMGLSGATYVGFKAREPAFASPGAVPAPNPAPVPPPPPAPPPPS